MLRILLLAGAIPAVLGACAQNMVAGEYWVDADPGFGEATPFGPDLGDTPQEVVQFNVATVDLSSGLHTIGYRTMDAMGRWSHTNMRPVYIVASPTNAVIVRTEYFLNTDPGWGAGLDADVDGAAEIPPTAITANLNGAVPGMNTLFYRTKDAHGHWSHTNRVPLYVENAPSGEIVAAESFWDLDPGFGQGDPVPGWTPSVDVSGQFNVMVPIDIGWGYHKLYLRTRDSHDHWSLTNWQLDSVNVRGTVDVNDLAAQTGISTYPNPFTDGITVRTDDGQPLRVVLYDPQGKLVHDKLLTGTTHIDLAHHASGAFTAFFWKDRERIHRTTLIKQ